MQGYTQKNVSFSFPYENVNETDILQPSDCNGPLVHIKNILHAGYFPPVQKFQVSQLMSGRV